MKQVFAKAQQYIHLRPDARTMRADQFCIALQAAEACLGLGCIVTLHYRPFTLCQIREHNSVPL